MNKDTKKIIAKEGLMLLGFLLLAAIIIFILLTTEFEITGEHLGQKIVTFGIMLLLFSYPIYLFFRFIIWAIKTLREK